ncbi:MAG: hypothetical protein AAFX58_11155 [Pseudomonadota bacterium]
MNDDRNDDRQQRVDTLLGDMRREVPPERDLWPGIEARLGEGEPGSGNAGRYRPYGLAAAVLATLAFGWVALGQMSSEPAATVVTTPQDGAAAAPLGMPMPVLASFPGDAFAEARQRELAALERRLAQLPPEHRTIVVANLETIRTAIAEIDAALAEHPDSDLLAALLVRSYQRELDTINAMNELTGSMRDDL